MFVTPPEQNHALFTSVLSNTIRNHFVQVGDTVANADAILGQLQDKNYVALNGTSVTYALPPKDA